MHRNRHRGEAGQGEIHLDVRRHVLLIGMSRGTSTFSRDERSLLVSSCYDRILQWQF